MPDCNYTNSKSGLVVVVGGRLAGLPAYFTATRSIHQPKIEERFGE